jgi:hypothetical protein
MSISISWYEDLREAYRPDHLKVLFIGESPPDPGDGERRFFYAPTLSQHDNLLRNLAEAIYGDDVLERATKVEVLERFREDGYWLIDALRRPINKAKKEDRRARIKAAVPALVTRCKELAPEYGVVICIKDVYEEAIGKLLASGVRVLHRGALPFPLYGRDIAFRNAIRRMMDVE